MLQSKSDLLTIAQNFERRSLDLLNNYNSTHKKQDQKRYDTMIARYTVWREAAHVLRCLADGSVSLDQLRKVTERRT